MHPQIIVKLITSQVSIHNTNKINSNFDKKLKINGNFDKK